MSLPGFSKVCLMRWTCIFIGDNNSFWISERKPCYQYLPQMEQMVSASLASALNICECELLVLKELIFINRESFRHLCVRWVWCYIYSVQVNHFTKQFNISSVIVLRLQANPTTPSTWPSAFSGHCEKEPKPKMKTLGEEKELKCI